MMKDVFICHASEDKPSVVHPLAKALADNMISYWLDEAEIQWGDSITKKVNDGLAKSKYVIVVLSQSSLNKNWPQRELNAVLNIEASNGEVKVLPLICGNSSELLQNFPLLSDKRFIDWNNGIESIINELKRKLGRNAHPISNTQPRFIIPNIRKKFTQRDKDIFIDGTFHKIRDYFSLAAKETESHYSAINIDIIDINAKKFIAKIYYNGNIINSCNIRVGGIHYDSSSIVYSEGKYLNNSDTSFNEMISMEEKGNSLALRFIMGISVENKLFNEDEAAEELWKRFIAPLERL